MSEVKKYVVNNVSEYVELIFKIGTMEKSQIWFRGHSSAMYRLTPSVLRKTKPLIDARGYPVRDGATVHASGGTVTGLIPENVR